MNLIDEGFRQWWKKYSALALFVIAIVNVAGVAAWTESPEFQAFVKSSPWALHLGMVVNAVVAALGFIGRFLKQADAIIDAGGLPPTLKTSAWVGVAAVLLALLLTAGCAMPGKVTPSGAVGAAYDSLSLFNRNVAQALDRGRITSAQGASVLAESRKVRQVVDDADSALALCGDKTPCDSVDKILARVQPMLLELERRLREEEAKKGTKQ